MAAICLGHNVFKIDVRKVLAKVMDWGIALMIMYSHELNYEYNSLFKVLLLFGYQSR